MSTDAIYILAIIALVALFLVLTMAFFFWRARSQNDELIALLATKLSEQNVRTTELSNKLNQDLNDNFVDKFYYLNQSLNDSIAHQNTTLNRDLVTLDSSFKSVISELSKLSEQAKISGTIKDEISKLNAILGNQKLRGNFGEYELAQILSMIYGENTAFFTMQKHLPNGKIADCALTLTHDTILCIDSKFPLSAYEKIVAAHATNDTNALTNAQKELAAAMRKHISDIAGKYILPPLTAEFAVLFLPSEAVFLEVCENLPAVLEFSARNSVFIASPTTLLSLLDTVRIFLKNDALAQNVRAVKDEIYALSKEFDAHAKHIALMQTYSAKFAEQTALLAKNAENLKSRFDKISDI